MIPTPAIFPLPGLTCFVCNLSEAFRIDDERIFQLVDFRRKARRRFIDDLLYGPGIFCIPLAVEFAFPSHIRASDPVCIDCMIRLYGFGDRCDRFPSQLLACRVNNEKFCHLRYLLSIESLLLNDDVLYDAVVALMKACEECMNRSRFDPDSFFADQEIVCLLRELSQAPVRHPCLIVWKGGGTGKEVNPAPRAM